MFLHLSKLLVLQSFSFCMLSKLKKVLIIDLDQQGNCSSDLGYKRDGKPTICELIYNTVAEQETVIEDTIRTSLDGIDYVPASPMLTNITSIISNDSDSNYVLKRAITNPLYNKYDYIRITSYNVCYTKLLRFTCTSPFW